MLDAIIALVNRWSHGYPMDADSHGLLSQEDTQPRDHLGLQAGPDSPKGLPIIPTPDAAAGCATTLLAVPPPCWLCHHKPPAGQRAARTRSHERNAAVRARVRPLRPAVRRAIQVVRHRRPSQSSDERQPSTSDQCMPCRHAHLAKVLRRSSPCIRPEADRKSITGVLSQIRIAVLRSRPLDRWNAHRPHSVSVHFS